VSRPVPTLPPSPQRGAGGEGPPFGPVPTRSCLVPLKRVSGPDFDRPDSARRTAGDPCFPLVKKDPHHQHGHFLVTGGDLFPGRAAVIENVTGRDSEPKNSEVFLVASCLREEPPRSFAPRPDLRGGLGHEFRGSPTYQEFVTRPNPWYFYLVHSPASLGAQKVPSLQ